MHWKSKILSKKFPLSTFAICSRLDATLCINASNQLRNPWRGYDLVGRHLPEPEWFADNVLDQMNSDQAPCTDEATTMTAEGSTTAAGPMAEIGNEHSEDNRREVVGVAAICPLTRVTWLCLMTTGRL
jgi:hypothetical protein